MALYLIAQTATFGMGGLNGFLRKRDNELPLGLTASNVGLTTLVSSVHAVGKLKPSSPAALPFIAGGALLATVTTFMMGDLLGQATRYINTDKEHT